MSWDPYSVLGVSKKASEAEIKKAYREQAKALHPDLHPGDAAKAEKFKKASAAFDILGDSDKRAKFDRGEIDADGNPRGFGGGDFRRGGDPFASGPQGDPFEDILSGIFGGGRARRGPGPRKGQDARYRIDIDFLDAVTGARRRMKMADGRTLDVNIPAGVETGQTLRLKSQGDASVYGGPPGDALLDVNIRKSKLWTRDGAHLRMDLAVDLPTAVLGGLVDVQTPNGTVSLKIPEGSNSGSVLRLRGKGVQLAQGPGNLYVRLMISLDDPKDPALKNFLKDRKT